jgi:hypothetical protein
MSKIKEESIEEISSMAGGDVAGYSLPLGAKKPKKKKGTIFREEEEAEEQKDFIEEQILRAIIYKALQKRHENKSNLKVQQKQADKLNEQRLRQVIRTLIYEAKKDIEDTPHSSTAINLLEDLLKQILPNLETEFKTLTTAKIQRDSFRAHVVSAVSALLETEDINKEGGEASEEEKLISLDEESEMEEEVDIKVSDVGASAEDKFIDIDAEPEEPEPEDTFSIEGQDATGRALAQDAFNNIEKNIAETYAILHDDEDEKLFEDYLITNLKLYFDKWEKELGAVTEPTTDEYEAEKDQNAAGPEAGAEFDAELGDELGGGIPAAGTGEELVQ